MVLIGLLGMKTVANKKEKKMATTVKNLNGTSQKNPPCGYRCWLDFWEQKTDRKAGKCAHCDNTATLGAHVKPVNGSLTYIVPLCDECNKRTDEFTVDKELVRAE